MSSLLLRTPTTMQPGLSTYSFPWAIGVEGFQPSKSLSAYELLDFAAAHHIRAVQFGDNLPLHAFSEEELNLLKATADRLFVNVEVGTRRLSVENISSYLSIAKKFKSPFLRVVIDDSGFHPEEQEIVKTIDALLPQLARTRIRLAIENHDRFPALTLRRIIEQTDPQHVGICLDTANSLGANEGIYEVLQMLGKYTVNLHVKDITIKRFPHKMGFVVEGCETGNGILDIPAIIKQLKVYGQCQTATLEVWSTPEATIEESIIKEKRWVESGLKYLKTILS